MGVTIIDFSEYLIWLALLLCLVSLVLNSLEAETFDSIVSFIFGFVFGILLWRVRKLGKAQTIMESVDVLKQENQKLNDTNIHLEEEVFKFESKLGDMRRLMKIFDQNNKTAEEIQNEMILTLNKLEKENETYRRLNRGHAFIIADSNHDGVLNESEQEIIQVITGDTNIKELDENNDSIITRTEYNTFI